MSLIEIRKSLSVMVLPGDVVELRIFDRFNKKYCGWFNDIDKMADAALSHDDTAEGTYYTCNACVPEMLAVANNRIVPCVTASTEGNIIRRRIFGLDIDPVRNPVKISSTDSEKLLAYNRAIEVRTWLSSQGFPLPVLGDSGNGYHLDYFVDLPAAPDIKKLYEAVYKVIQTQFPKDGVDVQGFADANRIWKVYGTIARKGENLPERPHRRSRLLEIPDKREIVTIELLQKITDMLPKDEPKTTGTNGIKSTGKAWTAEKLESWLNEHGAVIERTKQDGDITRFVLKACLNNPEHEGHKEAEVHIYSDGMIGYKCHHNSCNNVSWKGIREKLDPEYKRKKERATPYHWTDLGNAQRLKDMYGSEFRFCHPTNNWLVWDGTRWNTDKEAYLEQTGARGVIQSIYFEALSINDYEKKQNFVKFALKCESAHKVRSMIELAKSEPGIPILPDVLDKDPLLFNVQNGTIDLRTGIQKEHTKTDLITKISPVIYDATAKCPTWDTFLNKIFEDKKDLIEYMQRKAGYILTGLTEEEEFDELYGTGSNGKSKYVNQVLHIMGEYAVKANVETIQAASDRTSGNAASSDVARLKGARLVTVSEPAKGTQLNEQRVKDWTGRDPITARHLYQEPITFIPEFKLWIYTNYKLRIRGTDNGIWRRVKLVPFDITIPDDEQDKQLDKKLLKESSGILNWMIDGCIKWQKDGLKVPQEIIEATKDYREEQDYLGEFFKECCDLNKNGTVGFQSIYFVYRSFCNLMDMPVQGRIGFLDTLESKKFKGVHTKKGKIFSGICLKPEILQEYDEEKMQSGGAIGDGVTQMTQFLTTFLTAFSHRQVLGSASSASPPSPKKAIDNEIEKKTDSSNPIPLTELTKILLPARSIYEREKGIINSININLFSLWFCEQYKPKWNNNGESGEYTPSAIKGICQKVFALTPEPGSATS